MKNLTLTLLIVGSFFAVLPIHVTHAGLYEDCLAGKVPYPKSGTEASCGYLKITTPQAGGATAPAAGKEEVVKPAGTPLPGKEETTRASQKGDLSYSLQNPLAFESLEGFIVAVLNVIIVIATPIVVIFIILAGFKYVTARGNANDVQEATKALTYAIIGGVLIIGAVAIAEIIKGLVTAFS